MKAKWYVLQIYANFEKKVADAIIETAERDGISDRVVEIFIPTEEVSELKSGKKVSVQRMLHGGYIYIKLIMDDHIHNLIKNLPRVSGFLGANNIPVPLSEREIALVRKGTTERKAISSDEISFEVGDRVQVIDGPFQDFSGFINEVYYDRRRLRVMVAIFGRETSVELEYGQVRK
jgi:transcription termination/antitermination protein NusG